MSNTSCDLDKTYQLLLAVTIMNLFKGSWCFFNWFVLDILHRETKVVGLADHYSVHVQAKPMTFYAHSVVRFHASLTDLW